MIDLPEELVQFLKQNRQLEFDPEGTDVGRIRLRSWAELCRTVIEIHPDGCKKIGDPFGSLKGRYRVSVVDLVAESEDYDPEGLLCWVDKFAKFGSIDHEHSLILVFPQATWFDIVNDPARYLDQQWGSDPQCSRVVLPWLSFTFHVEGSTTILAPYTSICPLHRCSLSTGVAAKHELYDVLQRRFVDDWLAGYMERFPCSGVPANEDELLYCAECFAAENAWLESQLDAMGIKDATPRSSDGWIKCPGCGVRFSTRFPQYFRNNVHLSCGQRIRLREPEDNPPHFHDV